jgi:hypothetical protein
MPDATLSVVGTYLTAVDADLARTVLEAEGIECMIRSDDCGGVQTFLWMHGVDLLVRSEDALRAAEVLHTRPTPPERHGTEPEG